MLALETKLDCKSCTDVITTATVSTDNILWSCKHVDFLVRKGELPGSGVAITLSCDLSDFFWEYLLRKHDLSHATVEAIISLQGKFSLKDIEYIMELEKINGAIAPVLQLAMKECSPSIGKKCWNHLFNQALKYKKLWFVEELLKYSPSFVTEHSIKQCLKLKNFDIIVEMIAKGVQIEPALIIDEMSKSDITSTESKILSHLKSTLEGQVQLFFKAVIFCEFKLAETWFNEEVKKHVSLTSVLLKLSFRGNERERNRCISFIKGLLESGIDPNNKRSGEMCPLDVVLEFRKSYQAEKIEMLTLLIEYGAAIECCTYQKKNQTTLLHFATQLAIESGEITSSYHHTQKLFLPCSLFHIHR